MKLIYTSRFLKDIRNIRDAAVKSDISTILSELKLSENTSQLASVKKLKGGKNAYRIKIGDYRIGFFLDEDVVTLTRCAHRKDIYRSFP